jgi:riboflavin synthase
MFTGIVEAVGTLHALERRGAEARARIGGIELGLHDVKIGDSIAVSGVCLTVVALTHDSFEADISAETLARTTLGRRTPGDRLNLEKALTLTQRLGGHLVAGHVDGVGRLRARTSRDRSISMHFDAPVELARYIAEKGSVCIDGVSLTVNEVNGAQFAVNLVPHTLDVTTLGALEPNDAVNLEVDLIARYVERILSAAAAPKSKG